MNPKAIEQAKDSDLASSMNAMRRAAKRARQVAAQTGTFSRHPARRADRPDGSDRSG